MYLFYFLSLGYGLDSTGGGRTQSGGQSGAAGGRDPTDRRGRSSSIDISEQINIALQRLQSDMSSVLIRLNTLEALALSQAQQVGEKFCFVLFCFLLGGGVFSFLFLREWCPH